MTGFDLEVDPPFSLRITAEILRRRVNHLAEIIADDEFFHVFGIGGQLTLLGVKQVAPNVLQIRSPIRQLSTIEIVAAKVRFRRYLEPSSMSRD